MRIQRVPITERNSRMHTSTVTVAVIDPTLLTRLESIPNSELTIKWYSGSGNGGQARNKVQNCCRLIHKPTGMIKTAQFRDRKSSYQQAYGAMLIELSNLHSVSQSNEQNTNRKVQIGTGMRADKSRTFRFQDDQVVDHRTNKVASCKRIMKGEFQLLWS